MTIRSAGAGPLPGQAPVSSQLPLSPALKTPRRILIYRIGQIGDTIVALPAFRAIRQHFPDDRLALLSDAHPRGGLPLARAVLPASGLIDEWLTYPSDARGASVRSVFQCLPVLRRGRFDLLVYLAPRLRTPARVRRDLLFFRLAGISSVIGHRGMEPLPPRSQGLPLLMLEHEADHLLRRLALEGIPAPPRESSMDLALTGAERSAAAAWLQSRVPPEADLVGIAPGSKWPSKVWPEDRYAKLGQRLVEAGLFPVILGGPEDAPLAGRLLSVWGAGCSAAGELGIREAAAALEQCRLYVGNDTGTMHLAAAVGTPCVAIFSAQDWPGRWYPYGPGHTVLRRSVACEGCLLSRCEIQGLRCLHEIPVEEVLRACQQTLHVKSCRQECP